MKILGLDVSTKTGYAVISDGNLLEEGLLKADEVIYDDRVEDFALLTRATIMVGKILEVIKLHKPDMIFVEQTNAGKFRSSQKQLEFIHCVLLDELYQISSPENDYVRVLRYVDTSQWRSNLGIKLSKDERKHNKKVKSKEARGKITPKHLTVRWANSTYGLALKLKDNDRADAIALATFGYKNKDAPVLVKVDLTEEMLNP